MTNLTVLRSIIPRAGRRATFGPALRAVLAAGVAGACGAVAADEVPLERMAACQVSWLDWKEDPAAAEPFRDYFLPRFTQQPRSPAWTPRGTYTVFGLPVVQAYPQSVGMALGFSLEVRATAAEVQRAMEAAIGRPMKCEKSEGAMACEAKLGERRIAMTLTANDGRGPQSLIGCFYFYQQ